MRKFKIDKTPTQSRSLEQRTKLAKISLQCNLNQFLPQRPLFKPTENIRHGLNLFSLQALLSIKIYLSQICTL